MSSKDKTPILTTVLKDTLVGCSYNYTPKIKKATSQKRLIVDTIFSGKSMLITLYYNITYDIIT